jgi:hypothetical protein
MTRDELEIEQIRATIAKLNADTAKLQLETRWPPVIIAAMLVAIVGPAIAVVIAILGAAIVGA